MRARAAASADAATLPDHRQVCYRCTRPLAVCLCPHIRPIASDTRVVLIQHPRERKVPIGTALMASLCLPNSTLVVGVEVDEHPDVRAELGREGRTPILLWPSPGARDLVNDPPEGPVTLVVVDGTWSTAQKLVKKNPALAALPRYGLHHEAPSNYRIRREPRAECLSTIEAVCYALGELEGDRGRFQAMLEPFRAMVDKQIEFADARLGRRQRGRKRTKKSEDRSHLVPDVLRDASRLVVFHCEANAWPYAAGEARGPDELVHFVAERADGSARLDVVLAPQAGLSPSTCRHVRLSEDAVLAGATTTALAAALTGFLREGDVLASWSRYAADLAGRAGLRLGEVHDLRRSAGVWLGCPTGSLASLCERLGIAPEVHLSGRGGERLAQSLAVLARMTGGGRPPTA